MGTAVGIQESRMTVMIFERKHGDLNRQKEMQIQEIQEITFVTWNHRKAHRKGVSDTFGKHAIVSC